MGPAVDVVPCVEREVHLRGRVDPTRRQCRRHAAEIEIADRRLALQPTLRPLEVGDQTRAGGAGVAPKGEVGGEAGE